MAIFQASWPSCTEGQTQPRTLKLASGNGLGAQVNGLRGPIQAGLQPPGNLCLQLLWQPGAVAEYLSVAGPGLTSVSLYNPLSFL